MEFLKGKKTYIGMIALGLLAQLYALDLWSDGVANWISGATYVSLGGFIGAWTGVSFRIAVKGDNGAGFGG